MRGCALVLGAFFVACTPAPGTSKAFCLEDDDCGEGLSCVADLTIDVSYCSKVGCARDADCPKHQACRTGISAIAGGTETKLCIDRVRECLAIENCNGLDDDCDGTVDGPSCVPVTGCLDDAPCGVFVCTAPPNQPIALCAPPNEAATIADYEVCTADEQCRSNVCETGRCSALCRPPVDLNPCRQGFSCTRGIGSGIRPAYNVCQPRCQSPSDCSGSQQCVWRDVYQGLEVHAFVCAVPGPDRREIGVACPGNNNQGDDACASGLCFGCRCTRPCDGPGASCSDVSPDARCLLERLSYGAFELQTYVCSSTTGVCG